MGDVSIPLTATLEIEASFQLVKIYFWLFGSILFVHSYLPSVETLFSVKRSY